ncbi:MAG: glycosyltransferase family 2 protein [Paracoccaceae bacterium]
MLSIIIPAHNEQAYLGTCLASLMAQEGATGPVEIIVVANGCTDATVAVAKKFSGQAKARLWGFTVLDIPEGGKPGALDHGDAAASGGARMYLDADITCGLGLLAQIQAVLDRPEPAYASGRLVVAPAKSWVTKRFADLWVRLPFLTQDVPGAGLFAVNAAGRGKWQSFPRIISDDGYVRLLFQPHERHLVNATYLWPMAEGFATLVRVRRRQDVGIQEIAEKFPSLPANEGKADLRPTDHLRLFLAAPLNYLVYVTVIVTVRFGGRRNYAAWSRGR